MILLTQILFGWLELEPLKTVKISKAPTGENEREEVPVTRSSLQPLGGSYNSKAIKVLLYYCKASHQSGRNQHFKRTSSVGVRWSHPLRRRFSLMITPRADQYGNKTMQCWGVWMASFSVVGPHPPCLGSGAYSLWSCQLLVADTVRLCGCLHHRVLSQLSLRQYQREGLRQF